jgi:acyl-CoA synthetase (AMP-forming)/AMP-acid ligase II
MAVNYTSGTTSAPKGVCTATAGSSSSHWTGSWNGPSHRGRRTCGRCPCSKPTAGASHGGWTRWVAPTSASAASMLPRCTPAAIEVRGVTHLCCAPVVLNMMANAPEGVRRPATPGKGARPHGRRATARGRASAHRSNRLRGQPRVRACSRRLPVCSSTVIGNLERDVVSHSRELGGSQLNAREWRC